MDFKKYGKAISKDVEAAGITAQVKFAPSRAFTQLQKYVDQGVQLVPCEKVLKLGVKAVDLSSGHARLSSKIADVSPEASAAMIADFMRLMALLTDEEALARLVEDAPKKKDGHLPANRVALSCYMEGMFRQCEFYLLKAKCSKGDVIEITVERKSYEAVEGFGNSLPAGEVLGGDRYSDIVERMGLVAE